MPSVTRVTRWGFSRPLPKTMARPARGPSAKAGSPTGTQGPGLSSSMNGEQSGVPRSAAHGIHE